MKRRDLMTLGAASLAAPLLFGAGIRSAFAADAKAILRDPEAPETGNPKGDVTIVNFFDYNCPFCKKAAADLERAMREDGKVRLVFKDWPILTPASVHGARMALAAKYQGKYLAAHNAMMAIPGRRVTEDVMRAAVKGAGIDMARLDADMEKHAAKIGALLARNGEQADSLGLQGTPTYLIGPFRTGTLDYDGFKEALVEARRRQAAGQGIKE